ncbi:ribose ABC transporter permease protein [Secundilactobacillus silagincola]|uniref:Ribose ABC transporter permease protein n=1 Tax=Secundilactobacillus silagincola TaxID=1714681 RepID=A0A1Z5J4I4_9LACO|nr:ABC transporter permease [Secundilactobacillus silagincola]GAX08945.1 ribose ABC transporter permease protein [Secundilactobacillus silagincola]
MTNTQETSASEHKHRSLKGLIADYSAIFAFLILFIVAVLLKGSIFLSVSNIMNILMNNSIIGIIALGMTLVIITAGIDLAVGSQMAATGLIAMTILNATQSIFLAIVAAVFAGLVFGAITGGLISKFGVPAFIVTLGTMQIYRSVSEYYFDGGGILATGRSASAFTAIANTKLFGIIPMPMIYWFALCILISVIARRTAFGRHVYAIGSNERASFLSTINVNRVLLAVYALSGVLVALASIIEASRLGSMNSASSGSGYEMDAIAAVVIGGTSMAGGRGTILGTVFGTLTLGIINNLMNLLGVPSFLVGAIKGIIIIGALLIQRSVSKEES